MGKLNLISNFLQEFVVRAAPFWPPQSKSNAAEVKTQSPPAAATPSRKQSLERALSTAQLRKSGRSLVTIAAARFGYRVASAALGLLSCVCRFGRAL